MAVHLCLHMGVEGADLLAVVAQDRVVSGVPLHLPKPDLNLEAVPSALSVQNRAVGRAALEIVVSSDLDQLDRVARQVVDEKASRDQGSAPGSRGG
jgi:hypothetical protein